MDPLSAISLAGNLIQFIQFGVQIVCKASEIHKLGSVAGHLDLEDLTRDLHGLTSRLALPPRGETPCLTPNEKALNQTYDSCTRISAKLIEHLEKIKLPTQKRRKWKSFRQALKTVWDKENINAIARTLASYRAQMEVHLLVSLKEHQSLESLKRATEFQTLEKTVQDMIATFFKTRISDAETRILQILQFSTMTERYEEITEAYQKTFQWVFKSHEGAKPWSNFVEWLASDSGLYWINGKAGSGKSCLMRYIFDNSITKEVLGRSADGSMATLAGFFFWNSGTREQRSHRGLLRALLYQILGQHKEMIPHVFPEEWEQLYLSIQESDQHQLSMSWNVAKLGRAFRRARELSSTKFCLFIDGLDEYEGDSSDIVTLFKEVSTLPNTKICLSSRPWIAFEDAFQTAPSLRLQDLTYDDIKLFVHGKLTSHSRWTHIEAEDPRGANDLVVDITTKANGVFLWVKLIVVSLMNGMTNHDDLSDLQNRLRVLPTELERLYSHLLTNIDPPFYLEQASRIFQLVQTAREMEAHSPLEPALRSKPLTILQLSFAYEDSSQNPKYWDAMDLESLTSFEHLKRSQRMADVLKTRCAGLLELGDEVKDQEVGAQRDSLSLRSVTYLHQTVREFLEREGTWQMIISRTAGTGFSPDSRLLKSHVLWAKFQALNHGRSKELMSVDRRSVVFHALFYAYREDRSKGDPHEHVLDILDATVQSRYSSLSGEENKLHWSNGLKLKGRRSELDDSFIVIAIEFGLSAYIASKLSRYPDLIRKKRKRPLLHRALSPFPSGTEFETRKRIVQLLLERGASSSDVYKGGTMWQIALFNAESAGPSQQRVWFEIIRLFIRHGADPHILCLSASDQEYRPASEIVHKLFDGESIEAIAIFERWILHWGQGLRTEWLVEATATTPLLGQREIKLKSSPQTHWPCFTLGGVRWAVFQHTLCGLKRTRQEEPHEGTIICIMDSRLTSDGRLEYKVRWEDGWEDEWLSHHEIDAGEEIADFHRCYPGKPGVDAMRARIQGKSRRGTKTIAGIK